VRELLRRRSRGAALAACALSVVVHGAGGVVLATVARPPYLAPPGDHPPALLITLEVEVEVQLDVESAEGPALPAFAARSFQDGPLLASAVRGRRRPPPRPSLVLPAPEPAEEPVEPPPPEPAPRPPTLVERSAAAPPLVEPAVARALRVHDEFPSLVDRGPFRRPDLHVEVCVSAEGTVSDASIQGSRDPSTEALRAAILRWRYRPWTVDGAPAPFCHLMRISYRVY